MSSLWHEVAGHGWREFTLAPGKTLRAAKLGHDGISVYGFTQGPGIGALLLAQPGTWVRVNGWPVLGGACVLEHRDEVLTARGRLCFSAESTPAVVPFTTGEGGRPATCPLCRRLIQDGVMAVQCPGCGRWFHQAQPADGRPAKPCWTYAPRCRFCNHPTALVADAAGASIPC
jgi:hypothetical protein